MAVIAQHPILSAIPVDEDKPDTYFARLPEINLRRAVKFVARQQQDFKEDNDGIDGELDEIIENQHNTNFKEDYGQLPFWRVIVLHPAGPVSEFVVCFVFHHSLSDGASGLAFHRALLSALNNPDELYATSRTANDPESVDRIVHPPQIPLLPNLEDALPLPLSIFFILKTLWNQLIASALPSVWTASPIAKPASTQSRFQSFSMSRDNTQKSLIASRTNSTTLTATAQTLLAATLFEHLPSERYSRLMGTGAISLRRFMPKDIIDDDSMGTYVSAYKFMHLRTTSKVNHGHDNEIERFSWDEARRVKSAIDAELDKKGHDSVVGLLRYAGDLLAFLNKKVGKERDQSFEVSNIGVFKSAPANSGENVWSVGRMVFSQSANVAGPALEASLVTGGDGRLTLGFSWLEGIVDGDWVETVMTALKRNMENLAH